MAEAKWVDLEEEQRKRKEQLKLEGEKKDQDKIHWYDSKGASKGSKMNEFDSELNPPDWETSAYKNKRKKMGS